MQLDNITIIIINAHINSRSILREVLKSFLYKVKISYAQSLKEAYELIKKGENFDVGFVAFELGQPAISDFIASLKNEDLSNAPPFIATLKSRNDNSSSSIASLYLEGVAGFISEPYSSDDILNLLKAITQKKETSEQSNKVKKASNLLLNEAMLRIDNVAEQQSRKGEADVLTVRGLKNISKSLETLYQQDSEEYTSALLQAFEKAKPPKEKQVAKKQKAVIKEVSHPGLIVAKLMKDRKLSLEGLKGTLKIEAKDFKALLEGGMSIDDSMSRELSRVFGKTSKEWMKIQKDYDDYIQQINAQKRAADAAADNATE